MRKRKRMAVAKHFASHANAIKSEIKLDRGHLFYLATFEMQ